MSSNIKFKVGDLVKHVRKGDTWFPIPSDEHTGIILEVKSGNELEKMLVKVHWTSGTTPQETWEYPPVWISANLLEVVSIA
tara:strand:+ start:233 stop:475 length:243 start_codon:yes stop_codon:yes gene_type:complete